jgi:hypothetical protein
MLSLSQTDNVASIWYMTDAQYTDAFNLVRQVKDGLDRNTSGLFCTDPKIGLLVLTRPEWLGCFANCSGFVIASSARVRFRLRLKRHMSLG